MLNASTVVARCFSLLMLEAGTSDLPTCPEIIPHRGSSAELPENTLYALQQNQAAGFRSIEVDVQVTADHELVLYHPQDLSTTHELDACAAVEQFTAAEIQSLTRRWPQGQYGVQGFAFYVPRFTEALALFPELQFIVDLKSNNALELSAAIEHISADELSRLIFYTTEDDVYTSLLTAWPELTFFEQRSVTWQRLLAVQSAVMRGNASEIIHWSEQSSLGSRTFTAQSNDGNVCLKPSTATWLGYDWERTLNYCIADLCRQETFQLWSEASVTCTRQQALGAQLVFFGINTATDYQRAAELGASAVYSDRALALRALHLEADCLNQ